MQEYENIRLKREDVIKFAQYANLNEKDLESSVSYTHLTLPTNREV